MSTPASSAFISYSRDDSEFALRLARDLKTAGASVWLDQLDIAYGGNWDNAIEDALIAAQYMVLILSPASARSNNVRDEISYALEQRKIVIPVLYQDCTVPLRLQRKQRIDFRADYTRGLTALLAHLQVSNSDETIIDRTAEDEAKRHPAWEAREAETQRLRKLEEQGKREESKALARDIEHSLQRQKADRIAREVEAGAALEQASQDARRQETQRDEHGSREKEASKTNGTNSGSQSGKQDTERKSKNLTAMTSSSSRLTLRRSILAIVVGGITQFTVYTCIYLLLVRTGLHLDDSLAMRSPLDIVTAVGAGYLVGRLAPRHPAKHALILGCLFSGLSVAGLVMDIIWHISDVPLWTYTLVWLLSTPLYWLGGKLRERQLRSQLAPQL